MDEQLWRRDSTLAAELPMILLIDDEPGTLAVLERQLGREYRIVTALDGPSGLLLMEREGPIAAVVCDLWMPGIDGVAVLSQVRTRFPDTCRVLHSAHGDLKTAVEAINNGQVFRFLVKPCPPEEMRRTVRDAVEHYRVTRAERRVLDSTLRTSMQALFECIELASPAAFARAGRIRTLVGRLCHAMGLSGLWEIEVAAIASQLGTVTLPPDVLAKFDEGRSLSPDEQAMIDSLPKIAERIVGKIPRLGDVVSIIRGLGAQTAAVTRGDAVLGSDAGAAVPDVVVLGVEIIRAVTAFEALSNRGVPTWSAIAALEFAGLYRDELLSALWQIHGLKAGSNEVREVSTGSLRVGMRIMEDLRTDQGLVLIGRGTVVTDVLLDRLANFTRVSALVEPVLVSMPIDERARIHTRLHELAEDGTPDDVAFVHDLVSAFLNSAHEMVENLRVAIAGADSSQVASRAHTLKGAAMNVGAVRIADICLVIEQLGEQGQLSQAMKQVVRLKAAVEQAPVEFAAALERVTSGEYRQFPGTVPIEG